MLDRKFINFLGLPELEFSKETKQLKNIIELYCKKTSKMKVCPKCATQCTTTYDKRMVTIKDTPIRDKLVFLKITKRRFYCKTCKKLFTEPVQGIIKGYRSSVRFRKHILWCATNFADLKRVQKLSQGLLTL